MDTHSAHRLRWKHGLSLRSLKNAAWTKRDPWCLQNKFVCVYVVFRLVVAHRKITFTFFVKSFFFYFAVCEINVSNASVFDLISTLNSRDIHLKITKWTKLWFKTGNTWSNNQETRPKTVSVNFNSTVFRARCCRHTSPSLPTKYLGSIPALNIIPFLLEQSRKFFPFDQKNNNAFARFNRWESSQVPIAWDKHSSVPIPYQLHEVYAHY